VEQLNNMIDPQAIRKRFMRSVADVAIDNS